MPRRRKKQLPFEEWQLRELLAVARDFYRDPANEAAFQAWKAERDAAKRKRKKKSPVGAGTPAEPMG